MSNLKRKWLPFEEARAFARELNLKRGLDWDVFTESGNLPPNIPKVPQSLYKDKGWNGFGDWLGTKTYKNKKKEYLSFKEARKFARSLKLKNGPEWRAYCKSGLKPDNIPSSPYKYYDKEWSGINNWLVTKRRDKFLSFVDAKKYVRKQKLKTTEDWYNWCGNGKRPSNIPSNPNIHYKNLGWKGIRDWLGTR